MVAVGRGLTFTVAVPVKSLDIELHNASLNAVMV